MIVVNVRKTDANRNETEPTIEKEATVYLNFLLQP